MVEPIYQAAPFLAEIIHSLQSARGRKYMKFQVASNTKMLPPEGTHVLTLTSVSEKRVQSQFSKEADGMVDKLLWVFEPEAGGWDYAVWTKLAYGDDRAELTKLLDMLVPGMSKDRLGDVHAEDLVGKRYRVKIVHKVSTTTSKTYATHLISSRWKTPRRRPQRH